MNNFFSDAFYYDIGNVKHKCLGNFGWKKINTFDTNHSKSVKVFQKFKKYSTDIKSTEKILWYTYWMLYLIIGNISY